MNNLNNNINTVNNISPVNNIEKPKCLIERIDELFTPNKINNFLRNISSITDVSVLNEKTFCEIKDYRKIEEIIFDVIYNVSKQKYGFYKNNDDDSEYTPTDYHYSIIQLNNTEKVKISDYLDYISSGNFDKANDIGITPTFYVNYKNGTSNMKDIMTKVLLNFKVKDNEVFEKMLELFKSTEELIKQKVDEYFNENFKDGFNSSQDENFIDFIDNRKEISFYSSVFSSLNKAIIVDKNCSDDKTFHISKDINGVAVDIEFYPNIDSFYSKAGAYENVVEIIKIADRLSDINKPEDITKIINKGKVDNVFNNLVGYSLDESITDYIKGDLDGTELIREYLQVLEQHNIFTRADLGVQYAKNDDGLDVVLTEQRIGDNEYHIIIEYLEWLNNTRKPELIKMELLGIAQKIQKNIFNIEKNVN